ncbi:MAG: TolC family protein [Nitrospiraceae bacterium]|nr:MAG: TolC family protein [Nitrospiraceae bacterium]
MRFFISVCISILVIFSIVHYAGAEILTLKQAVNMALRDNPDLKAYTWSIYSQKNNANAEKGRYYPRFNIEERFLRTDNPTFGFMSKLNQERFSQEDFLINRLNNPDDISDFQTLITVEQPLFVPQIHIGFGMAHKELKAKEAEFQSKQEGIALDVVKMFLRVRTAREHVHAAQKTLEDALEHKRLASSRFDAGAAVYYDKLRTDVAEKNAEALLASAEADLEVARRALGMVLGKTEPVYITGDTIVIPLSDLNSCLAASLNRKDIKAQMMRYENAKAEVKMQKSDFLPEIGMRGSYQMNDHESPFSPDGESYMIMGFLKWNLFDASKYSRIKKAKADEHVVREHLTALKNRVNFSVHDAYIRVREKEQKLILSRVVLKEAEEAIRLVRLRYENSLASIVDLLDTQVMLNNARAGIVSAESDYTGSIADLHYQSGTLLNTLNTLQ